MADKGLDIRQTVEAYFKARGFEVQTLELAGDVIKTARFWQPSAILLSNDFPDQNPYQVCRDLMDDPLISHIPMILLLRVDERQTRIEALEAGASDIVAKPFDIEELYLRVEATIRLSTMPMDA